jgi:multisubunit Na+/H+ antiporter MnhF subunit
LVLIVAVVRQAIPEMVLIALVSFVSSLFFNKFVSGVASETSTVTKFSAVPAN